MEGASFVVEFLLCMYLKHVQRDVTVRKVALIKRWGGPFGDRKSISMKIQIP